MWGKKKVKPLINNNLTFCFVTSNVEKSNFYKDLEGVLNYEIKEIDTKKK